MGRISRILHGKIKYKCFLKFQTAEKSKLMEAERFSTAPGDEGRQGNGNLPFGQVPSLSHNGTRHDVYISSETSPLIVNAEDNYDENLEDVDETASPQISQAPPDNYYLVFSKMHTTYIQCGLSIRF